MKIRNSLLASSALLLSIALSGAANAADKWTPQVELEGKAGTSGRKLGVTKMMAPLWQDNDTLVYSDIRYKFDNQDSQEYNLGLGWRTKIDNTWALGGYGFFDRMKSDSENIYSQGTFGLEALTEDNDLRANIYIPETTKNGAPGAAKLVISGTNAISVQGGFERALHGADFEIGQKINLGLGDFRVYGGGYNFSANGYDSVTGPRARMELKLDENDIEEMPLGATLTVGAEFQRDDVRGEEAFGLVKLTVPLWESEEKSKLSGLDKRMNIFVNRDVDVVSGNGGTESATINGAQVNGILEMNSGQDFVSMVNGLAGNTILLVDGSTGTILSGTGTGTLTGNQAIIGGGATVTITGAKSGTSFSHTFSGTAPTIDATGGNALLLDLADNTLVAGLTINGTIADTIDGIEVDNVILQDLAINDSGDDAIYIEDSNDITIIDSTINGTVEEGIEISGTSDVEISGVTIDDAGDNGIDIREDSEDVEVTDTTVSNSGDDGIQIFDGASNVLISDVTIDTAVNWGIIIDSSSDVEITNVDISDTGDDAIKIQEESSGVDISDVTVDTTGSDGMAFDDSSDITMSGVTINNADDGGLDIENITGATISDLTVNDAGFVGIEVHGTSSDITISDSEINDSAGDGLAIYETVTDVIVDGLEINDSGDDGIDLEDTLGTVSIDNVAISTTTSDGFEFDGATVTSLSGTGNTVTGAGATNCTSTGATITGSLTYNTNQTCP